MTARRTQAIHVHVGQEEMEMHMAKRREKWMGRYIKNQVWGGIQLSLRVPTWSGVKSVSKLELRLSFLNFCKIWKRLCCPEYQIFDSFSTFLCSAGEKSKTVPHFLPYSSKVSLSLDQSFTQLLSLGAGIMYYLGENFIVMDQKVYKHYLAVI